LQLVNQLIQVDSPGQNQPLFGFAHHLSGNGYAAVKTQRLHLERHLVAQRIHQPWLPLGVVPSQRTGLWGKDLPCLGGVLVVQSVHLRLAEVAQPDGFHLDVEGAATGDDFFLRTGVDAVVAHIAHATQNQALRKRMRAVGVASTQLAQDRNKAVANEGINLVNEQQQRARVVGLLGVVL